MRWLHITWLYLLLLLVFLLLLLLLLLSAEFYGPRLNAMSWKWEATDEETKRDTFATFVCCCRLSLEFPLRLHCETCGACGTTSFDLQWILKQFVGLFPIVINGWSVCLLISSVAPDPHRPTKSFGQLIFKYKSQATTMTSLASVWSLWVLLTVSV